MKRRLLSGLLAVLMVLSILPVMALGVSALTIRVTNFAYTRTSASNINVTLNNNSGEAIRLYYAVTTSATTPTANYSSSIFSSGYTNYKYVNIDKKTTSQSKDLSTSTSSAVYLHYFFTGTTLNPDEKINPTSTSLIPVFTSKISVSSVSFIRDTKDYKKAVFKFTPSKACFLDYIVRDADVSSAIDYNDYNDVPKDIISSAQQIDITVTNKAQTIYYRVYSATDETEYYENSITIYAYSAIDKVEVSRINENTATVTFKLKSGSFTGKTSIRYAESATGVSTSGLVYSYNVSGKTESITVTGIPATATRLYYSLYTYYGESYQSASSLAYIAIPAYSATKAPAITEWTIKARQSDYALISFKSDSAGYFSYEYNVKEKNKNNKSGELTMTKAGVYELTVSNLTPADAYWIIFKTKGLDATSTFTSTTEKAIPSTDDVSLTPDFKTSSAATFTRKTTDTTKADFKVYTNVDSIIYYRVGASQYTDRSQIGTTYSFYCTGGSIGGDITVTVPTTKTYISYYAVNALDSTKYSEVKSLNISNATVDDVTAPTITELSPSRTGEKVAALTFKSTEAGIMSYAVGSATISDEAKLTTKVGVAEGSNTIQVALSSSGSYIFTYLVADASGNKTLISSIVIPAYTGSGTTSGYAPTINSVTRSTENGSYVNANTGVTVTVTATAHPSYTGTKTLEYTFDGGITWSTVRTKTYTENTSILLNTIQVRHYSDSAISKYSIPISISNIDKLEPTATVATSPSSVGSTAAKVATVKVTVTAKDQTASTTAQSGLNEKAYSFDGGKTWQADNFKEYTKNTEIAADTIQVRDAVSNIYKYPTAISIENIDSSVPKINIVKVTRSSAKIGSIELTSDEEGTFYYYTIYDAKDKFDTSKITAEERDSKIKTSYTLKEGTNTFQISLTAETEAIIYYFVKDKAGNASAVSLVTMPKFTEEDKTAPVIEKVTPSSTSPTKDPVKVTVTAKDETALDNSAYSFDNGVSWQADPSKEYKENTTINAEYIQVKDAGGNITKWKEKVEIKNIDTTAPTISSVTPSVSGKTIIITVTAADNVGLATSAYSFDGGENWQTDSKKSYSAPQDIAANTIQVRDTAGNITKYQQKISKETLESILTNVWQNPFTDVNANDWYYDYVKFAVQNGLFKGTSDTKFDPNANMTRAMFVTVLGRLDGFETARYTTSAFTDVPTGQWYTPYIAWAVEKGIVSGYGNSIFGLNDNITREQMCVMIKRYLDYKSVNTGFTAKDISFSDAAKISSWAKEAVSICEQAGIVIGTNNNFNPSGNATRAEVATIFSRISSKYFG